MARKKIYAPVEQEAPQTIADIDHNDDHIVDDNKMVSAQEKEPESNPSPAAKQGPVIYVGPTLSGGLLVRYTTFRDGQPRPHIKQLIEQCSAIGKMIVPVTKLAETERKLLDSSSIEAGRFAEILKYTRKGA